MTVFFHGNFGLNRARMAQLLNLALTNPDDTDRELAKSFGYGAPFASVYRSWLHKCGLTNLRRPTTLTDLGAVIHENDNSLSATPTLWFMHHQLSQIPDRAEAWHFFIHKFRPAHSSFTLDELRRGLVVQLSPHSMRHFGEGSKMVPIIARKLVDCYTSASALGPLALVQETSPGHYAFSGVDIPEPCLDIQTLSADFD